jgi:lipopolysaccharide export system permease protein
MQGVTFLKYEHQHLKEIIVSEAASWDEVKEFWRLTSGHQYLLNDKGAYETITPFQELPLRVTRNVLDYADDHRDNREMNVIALHQRLKIIQNTDNSKQIRPLKMSIQERYAMPFSCFVFALLGSAVGFTTATASKANSFGIAALLILAYYMIQFVANCLIVVGALPVSLGVWLPNLLGLALGYNLLRRRFLLTVSR